MKRSDWMEGLLWGEEYIQKGKSFEGDTSGVKSLHWELYHNDSEGFKRASDYLEFYKHLK